MALLAIIAKEAHEALHEEVQKEYKEQADGKFVLEVTSVDGFALEDITGLQSALGAERKKAKDAVDALKVFEDLDPEVARTAIAKVGEMADWTPEQKVQEQIEHVKSQLVAEHTKAVDKKDGKIASLESQLNDLLIVAKATTVISEKYEGASIKGLMPHIRMATQMKTAENGDLSVEVIDGNGNPRVAGVTGDPMSIAQLVDEFSQSPHLKGLFPGSGANGSGATGEPGGGAPPGTIDPKLPPTERLKLARRNVQK